MRLVMARTSADVSLPEFKVLQQRPKTVFASLSTGTVKTFYLVEISRLWLVASKNLGHFMKSNFSRLFRLNRWISTKHCQKKVVKIPNGDPKNGIFSPNVFLDIQQSSGGITFSLSAKLKEKTCQKAPWWQYNQSDSAMTSFWQQFLHSKSYFWLKPTIPGKFYIFWEWDEQSKVAIIIDGFDTQ